MWTQLLLTFISFNFIACRYDPSIHLSTSCGDITNHSISCCMCDWLDQYDAYVLSSNQPFADFDMPFGTDVSRWTQLCSFIYGLLPCLKEKTGFSQCSDDLLMEILDDPLAPDYLINPSCPCGSDPNLELSWKTAISFYSRTCTKDKLNDQIQALADDQTLDTSVTCIDDKFSGSVPQCLRYLDNAYDRRLTELTIVLSDSKEIETVTSRYYTDLLNCVFSVINKSSCNTATKKLGFHLARLLPPPYISTNENEIITEDVTSSIRCTIGVYGDPQLKTCWKKDLVACSAPGEQIYIKNKYIVIKGENIEIGPSIYPRATVLASVSISFNSFDGENIVASYTAMNGDLPTSFDSLNSTTAGDGEDMVQLSGDQYGSIQFNQQGAGAVMILRQWGGNYFFTLRMADNVLIGSIGVVIDGCPADQVVTLGQFLNRGKRDISKEECYQVCYSLTQSEFYDSCLLDCLATGDLVFAETMTRLAEADYAIIKDSDSMALEDAKKFREDKGGATTRSATPYIMLLATISWLSVVL